MKSKHLFLIVIPIFVFIGFKLLSSKDKEVISEKNNSGYEIWLVKTRYINKLPYNFNDSKWNDFMQNAELEKILINENDIEEYDWSNQNIILNSDKSDELKNILNEDRFELEEKNFIITFNGKRLIGGVTLARGSARYINYPVIYFTSNDDKISISIRPYHDLISYSEMDKNKKQYVEYTEVKNYFLSNNKILD